MFREHKAKIGLLAIAMLLSALFLSLSYSRPFFDEGIYATGAWLNAQGQIPYNDFFLLKPPGIILALSSWFSVFGATIFSARLLSLAASLATALGIFLLGRKMFSEKAGLFAALFYALWLVPFSGYFAVIDPFLALAAAWSALMLYLCFKEGKRWQMLAFGFLLALSLLFKQTMAVFVLGSMALALWIHPRAKERKPFNFLLFAIGFLLPLLSLLAYLLYFNAFQNFLDAVLFAVSGEQNFAVMEIDERLLIPLAAFAFVPIALLGVWKNLFGLAAKKKEILLLTALFVLTLANAFPFRGCCIHAIPALPFASLLAGLVFWASLEKKNRALSLVSILLFAITLAAMAFSQAYFLSPEYSFSGACSPASYVQENTSPNDRVLVMPASPEIYFLAQRQPATRQLYFFGEYSQGFQQKAIDEIAESNPAMVVYLALDRERFWSGPERVDAYLQESFFVSETLEVNPPLYKFYKYAVILKPKPV